MGSIVDVAREARVSLGTASKVLNHPHRVAPETLEQVTQVMKRMGYRPRPNRRRAAASTRCTAFIYPELGSIDGALSRSYLEVIAGIREGFGSFSTVNTIRGREGDDTMFQQQVVAREFSGVFVFASDKYNTYAYRAMDAGLPVVMINAVLPDGRCGSVAADHYMGAQQALKHAADMGHRRLAVLYATPTTRPESLSTQQIKAGLSDAAQRLECAPVVIEIPKAVIAATVRPFCERVLQEKATVILAGERLAVQCADVFTEMGLIVPEDISIISFDYLGLKTTCGKELTTVAFDKRLFGRLAAQAMRQMAEYQGSLRRMRSELATHISMGQTCVPPRMA